MSGPGQVAAARRPGRRIWRWTWRLAAILCGPPLLYLLAALVLSNITVHRDWRSARDGVQIFVWSNGVHTDFVLPVVAAGWDWSTFVPRGFDTVARPNWILVGWGDRGFYIETPTWDDLKARTVIHALLWPSESVMHTSYRWSQPDVGPDCCALVLRPDEYRRLVERLRAGFRLGQDNSPQPVPAAGYDYDFFYAARGSYHLFNTCNNWANRVLGQVGVRTPLWSPFAGPILASLPR